MIVVLFCAKRNEMWYVPVRMKIPPPTTRQNGETIINGVSHPPVINMW